MSAILKGLLSDLPAIGTALLGVLTGLWLRGAQSVPAKTLGLAAASCICLALGYLWSLWFPLNKNMWTSSFVLVAGGYSLALLTFAFWAVEQKGWRKGWTWVWLVFGSNAIAAYMFSELLPGVLGNIYVERWGVSVSLLAYVFLHSSRTFLIEDGPHLPIRCSFCAVCFIPVWILYRKKIFLKI